MTSKPNQLLLTLPEYRRIYEVIYSVLEGRANTPHACMFFAITGSVILNKHYKIPARPVAGAFLLCVDAVPSVVSIGKNAGGMVSSDQTEFHMWVQTEHHVIDFMAPIFHDSMKRGGSGLSVPRKMFQRLLSDEAESIDSLRNPGQFFTIPNIDLTRHFAEEFTNRPSHMDLLQASDTWFKKHPKKLGDLSLANDLGEISRLTLKAPTFSGAW